MERHGVAGSLQSGLYWVHYWEIRLSCDARQMSTAGGIDGNAEAHNLTRNSFAQSENTGFEVKVALDKALQP